MQFTYTVEVDGDYTPWGDADVIAEETRKINNQVWQAYVVTAHHAGPIDAEESCTGCVVPVTHTGTFRELDAIMDPHLREIAKQLSDQIASGYFDKLITKRAEIDAMIRQIDAMIRQMGGS